MTVPVAPVVLDALHVPLVDDNNDFLALRAVNFFEEFLVLLINVSESIAVIVLVLLVAHTITIVVLKVVKETIAIVISVL